MVSMIEALTTKTSGQDVVLSADTKQAVGLFMAGLRELDLPAVSKVLLYGSRARGDHDTDSDVDIAVVMSGSCPETDIKYDLTMLLAEVSSKAMLDTASLVDVSAIVIWEDQLYEPQKQRNPDFYQNLLVDGVEIWWKNNR